MSHQLDSYQSKSGGRFEPVWTLEIQTVIDDVDLILDSAVGMETSQPPHGSTTATHLEGFEAGATETYPMVELKVSVERDANVLGDVMDAVLHVHRYEEPVIFLREDWASRAPYDPNNDNPHRWWNNGRGLPDRIDAIC